ncbi:MAG: HEAT repeat domain-containing protein [Chloroflexota bacterium]
MSDAFTTEQLIQDLSHPDWQRRYSAADRLKVVGDERATPALIALLRDDNATVRFIAARTLGIFRSEAAVQSLVDVLAHTDDHDLQWAVAQALAEIGEAVVEPLIQLLDGDSATARAVAADVLSDVADPRAIDPLADAFTRHGAADFETVGRVATAAALEKFGERAVLALLTALDDKTPLVRARAAASLGRMRNEDSVPAIIDLLADDATCDAENRVCDIAALALQSIGTAQALAAVNEWQAG